METHASSRFDALVTRLQREAEQASRDYPDRDSLLEQGPFAAQKQRQEQKLCDDLWQRAMSGQTAHTVLDAGCGEGRYSPWLRKKSQQLLSIDPDPVRLARAASKVATPPGDTPPDSAFARTEFVVASAISPALSTPEVEGLFSMIVCIQVLGHISAADTTQMLHTFAHLLQPGGWLLLSVPYHTRPWDVCLLASQRSGHPLETMQVTLAEYDVAVAQSFPNILPVRHFCTESLASALQPSGFSIREEHPYHWRSNSLADLMLLLQRPLTDVG